MFDIPPIIWYLKKHIPKFVSKKELAKGIPSISYNLRNGGAALIDRKDKKQAITEMVNFAKRVKSNNWSAVIFPEGTRIPPGNMGELHPGVAALYKHLNISVVPVAVNSGLVWPRRQLKKEPGTIIVEFLKPIQAGMEKRAFLTKLRQIISEATLELENESRLKDS